MIGRYDIEIYNNRVHYFLTVKRNITILQGNSATGKTELIRLIGEYEENGVSSGITVKCDVRCTVLTSVDWELRLSVLKKTIVFIDETAGFIKSKRYAEMVRGSDNYFVIVTRGDLSQLPYSVEEIYGLKTDASKYKIFRKVYNELYRIYNISPNTHLEPDVVITEDSNSGNQCFAQIYHCPCESAGGKSRVYEKVRNAKDGRILVIVDGAAFGPEMSKLSSYLKQSNMNYVLYAPESFEYLILEAGIIHVSDEVLRETFKYADSCKYLSWEEFYTAYLMEVTAGTIYRYNKSYLGEAYKTGGTLKKIISALPEQIRPGISTDKSINSDDAFQK